MLLIFAHIGWGKPVQINPRNFGKKYSMSAGEAIVSVAGPAMNFVLAIVLTIIYFAISKVAPSFVISRSWILCYVYDSICCNCKCRTWYI